jgi:anti-sigma-K factor RskA
MQPAHDELIDRLAAEYVLGTLRGPARARFERWMQAGDAAYSASVRQAVHRWENRLVHLADDLQPVDPSPQVWRALRARIAVRKPTAQWPRWALAASVMLVAFLAWFAIDGRETVWQPTAQLREDAASLVRWDVALDGERTAIRIQAQTPLPLDKDRVHELWALPAGGQPVSLGILPRQGATERRLTAVQVAALATARQLAVSLEPSGGSPTGAPTGPVLMVVDRLSS